MLRLLLLVLVLANLLFIGWTRGWLAPLLPPSAHGERERDPARLQAQVRPETVTVLVPVAASAAVQAARKPGCVETGPFIGDTIEAAEAALVKAGVPAAAVRRATVTQPAQWVVYAGPFAERDAQRRKEDELRRLRLDHELLADDRAPQPGLALGRHDEREAAEKALATLIQRGLRGARVLELPARPQPWLRVSSADRPLLARLTAGEAAAAGQRFTACAADR